jgi:hypothetical protein
MQPQSAVHDSTLRPSDEQAATHWPVKFVRTTAALGGMSAP